jgi:diaminopimelate decarboxylase
VRAHEAGALHANLGTRGPAWLSRPDDVNTMDPALWPATASRRPDGAVEIGGVALTDLAAEFGTPTYVLDESDFRGRARAYRRAFEGFDVYYAGKAFLASAVVRWAVEEGLRLDVCSGGELALAVRAGVAPAAMGFHGNNKSEAELTRALESGVGRIIVDSFFEIDRLVALTESLGIDANVLVRVTAGVEAHTHEYIATAHEDQKFGFSIGEGEAFAAVQRVLASDRLTLLGLHSHIGSQIFDTSGFEVAARRVLALHARICHELGVELPELGLGGGFGIAYTSQDDPQPPSELAEGLRAIVEHECRARQLAVPRVSIEPGRALVGPAMCTVYEIGTVKDVALDAGATRRYISVDGGMSDNIRTALYDADYACTLVSRAAQGPPILSRLVGKHCEAGDIVVKDEFVGADVTVGDLIAVPGTGAYCRSMASNYNHLPRPAVVAVRDGRASLVVRRETEEDLLRLDVV